MEEADRAQQYVLGVDHQPHRVALDELGLYHGNREGQGRMPIHTHDIAHGVVSDGTSSRRYDTVRCVEVPEECREEWRAANAKQTKQNPLLASCVTKNMWLATLKCTHFVGACKLVKEGNRTFMNQPEGKPLKLLANDVEGRMIQTAGVIALIYGKALWYAMAAMMALMREDNANSEVSKPETELDAFGTVHETIKDDWNRLFANHHRRERCRAENRRNRVRQYTQTGMAGPCEVSLIHTAAGCDDDAGPIVPCLQRACQIDDRNLRQDCGIPFQEICLVKGIHAIRDILRIPVGRKQGNNRGSEPTDTESKHRKER